MPKPAQRPHPPFLVAGGGRRALELAAREADIVGINVSMPKEVLEPAIPATATVARTAQRVGWTRAAAGERMDEVELSILAIQAVVAHDPRTVARDLAAPIGTTADEVLASPQLLVGPVGRIVEERD